MEKSLKKNKKTRSIAKEIVLIKRISKRGIFLSFIISLITAWFFLSYWFNKRVVPSKLALLSDFLFQNAIFQLNNNSFFGSEIMTNLTNLLQPFKTESQENDLLPGKLMKKYGVNAKFPIVIVPGAFSTGLELWEGKECAMSYFRERLWGSLSMLRSIMSDKACWISHMKLNITSAKDPIGIRIRAAQGIESADFLIPGYWVWARIIENLAEIGYDHNNLIIAPYDWRLDVVELEKRDKYFLRLKSQIELLKKTNNNKIVVMTHSLGSLIWFYFMKWVEADVNKLYPKRSSGNGGKEWVQNHIESFISIGGPFLGAPKGVSMMISGESRETAHLGVLETFILEKFLSRKERTCLLRSWIGGHIMNIKGGLKIWDRFLKGRHIIKIKGNDSFGSWPLKSGYTAGNIFELVKFFIPSIYFRRIHRVHSFDSASSLDELDRNDLNPRKWSNPLEVKLPLAPDLKIYCFYGIGKKTETGYHYKKSSTFDSEVAAMKYYKENSLYESLKSVELENTIIPMQIDTEFSDINNSIDKGVFHLDGDGTVPLISLGLMCAQEWKKKHFNPRNASIYTKEYLHHEPSLLAFRGPKNADHVDILGNHELINDILLLVSDASSKLPDGQKFQERIISNIKKI